MGLRVGIAGFWCGWTSKGECVARNCDMELVAVCDKQLGVIGAPPNIQSFDNYEALLKADIDVLFVCLTNDIAAEVTKAGLKEAYTSFVRNRPGEMWKTYTEVIKTEQRHPTQRLMYGFNHRYHNSVQDALQIIKSGRLGKIINMRGVYGKSKLTTFNQTDWRTKREISGGGVLTGSRHTYG